MSVINRVPKPFLSLLEAKTQGQTPSETSPILSPTLDMTDFYWSDVQLQSENQVAVNVNSIGDYAQIVVPAGKLWNIILASATVTVTTGSFICNGSIIVGTESGSQNRSVVATNEGFIRTLTTVGSERAITWNPVNPFYMGPGGSIFYRQHEVLGTNERVDMSIFYRELSI